MIHGKASILYTGIKILILNMYKNSFDQQFIGVSHNIIFRFIIKINLMKTGFTEYFTVVFLKS